MTVLFSAVSAGKILFIVLLSLTLSGCGGGGVGGTAPSRPSPGYLSTVEGCLTPTQYRTRIDAIGQTHRNHAGFSDTWALGTINADEAWAKLQIKRGMNTEPGFGIALGVIDSGIDTGHPVFSGKTVTEIFLHATADEDGTRRSHGTSVASIMVAAPSSSFISQTAGARGVAWSADITMFAVPVGSGGRNYIPISLADLNSVQARWVTNINRAKIGPAVVDHWNS